MRLINVLPGFTTLHACCSFPTSDSSSFKVQKFLPSQLATMTSAQSAFLPGGIDMATVSISIPKKVRVVAGPSSFSGATGTNSLAKTCRSYYNGFLDTLPLIGSHPDSARLIHPLPSDQPLKSIGLGIIYFGEEHRPKGSAESTNKQFSHTIPSRSRSSRCTGTIL